MATATISVTARVPQDISARYDRLARSSGRTKTYYINEALAEAIDQLEYEYGILQRVEDIRSGRAKTYSADEVRERCGLVG